MTAVCSDTYGKYAVQCLLAGDSRGLSGGWSWRLNCARGNILHVRLQRSALDLFKLVDAQAREECGRMESALRANIASATASSGSSTVLLDVNCGAQKPQNDGMWCSNYRYDSVEPVACRIRLLEQYA